VACDFSLHLPEFAVGVKDSVAEEVLEVVDEAVALRVVLESGFEHVFHVVGVGRYDAVETVGAGKDGGVGGAVAKDLGAPFEEAMAVFEEFR